MPAGSVYPTLNKALVPRNPSTWASVAGADACRGGLNTRLPSALRSASARDMMVMFAAEDSASTSFEVPYGAAAWRMAASGHKFAHPPSDGSQRGLVSLESAILQPVDDVLMRPLRDGALQCSIHIRARSARVQVLEGMEWEGGGGGDDQCDA